MFTPILPLVLAKIAFISALAIPIKAPPPPLQLTTNSTFQISIFSDLHFGEAEDTLWGPNQDMESTGVMNAVLDSEEPQLVVLNGDLITGENTFLANSTRYLDAIVAPLVHRNLNWASTYGNHDSDANLSRQALFAHETSFPGSLTTDMLGDASAGVTNYVLPVFSSVASSSSSSSTPAFLLWFFDSRGGKAFQEQDVELPNWVDPAVVAWFTTTSARLRERYHAVIPSVAFVHIPVSAMRAFQARGGGVGNTTEPGVDDDKPLAAQGNGDGGQDEVFMEALVRTEGLRAVFSGHDHGDSWCMRWEGRLAGTNVSGNGLDLCFGQRSGYGGYGRWIRGSRQVLLREGTGAVETWVRMEDGSVSGRVVLNETYGVDKYPVVLDRDSYGGIVKNG